MIDLAPRVQLLHQDLHIRDEPIHEKLAEEAHVLKEIVLTEVRSKYYGHVVLRC